MYVAPEVADAVQFKLIWLEEAALAARLLGAVCIAHNSKIVTLMLHFGEKRRAHDLVKWRLLVVADAAIIALAVIRLRF